jgi:DNA topoisomerase-2
MVFNKKRADDRKTWLEEYERESYLDTNKESVTYEEFVNKELIHFSKYDCDRSIPNLMDGLKISLRKILYSAFKKNLNSEIKVAQFSGYISENSGYHHGEASLNAAIVGMAQNFVGSNNINLFMPNGQFGTRLQGGKDSASERYIFTALNKLTRVIFPSMDDNILTYVNDDGLIVEPLFYAPIIPMILVNGTKGIGTGFSTDIMCYNPLDIIHYLQNKLQNINNNIEFLPYYEGFKGTIEKISNEKFVLKGIYKKITNDTINVTELPIGFWTEDFKELLEELIEPGVDKEGKKITPIIKDYDDMSKDTNVDFIITFAKGKLEELEKNVHDYGCNGVDKLLKLYTTNTTSNMHLFNHVDKLKKYDSIQLIIDDYFDVRLHLFETRKEYLIQKLEKEVVLLSNKARYIEEILNETIDLRKKNKENIIQLLNDKGYTIIEEDNEYKYLTKMPMDSVTNENITKLNNEKKEKDDELHNVMSITAKQMWLRELNNIEVLYIEYKKERNLAQDDKPSSKKNITTGASINKKIKK